MRFDYYQRLSAKERRVYQKSDAIASLPLPDRARLLPLVAALERALASEKQSAVQTAAGTLVAAIARQLGAPPVEVSVLAKRPKNREGELHGLYTLEADGSARIEVWMRTAEKRRVVAFRTFLRTLLHELCHHLDFSVLRLAETYHTEGFFRRESSLFRQLAPAATKTRPSEARPTPERTRAARVRREPAAEPRQLSLFS